MKCLAVCQEELVIRLLARALSPSLDIEFLVEDRLLARRLNDADVTIHVGDSRRVETYVRLDVGPGTAVLVE
ncbi:MAG: hypothetical protein OSB03_19060, partial [Vicinamibacterales bacterium]|nr:hypothetical protein [Vicinamibacterales bacterium]